jgi:hypothetical protein
MQHLSTDGRIPNDPSTVRSWDANPALRPPIAPFRGTIAA